VAVRPGNREGKLRSVDSERTGRVIEPRNLYVVEADAFGLAAFRPGRSAHQALQAIWKQSMDFGSCWVLEADIEDFFGSVDPAQLREILRQRVQDGVLLRLIGKWLKAGVLEEGRVYRPETGVPQGGAISPILSNIYLHEVLDQWFAQQVKPRLQGQAHLTRFADDFVMVFETEADARRVQAVLPKRFGKYGLRLHPGKTRLVHFAPPPSSPPPEQAETQQGRSFDLLGLTLYWGRSRKGRWVVMQKTAKDRFRRSLRRVSLWCQDHRHDALREQHVALSRKLQGHYAYYGVTGNFRALLRYLRANHLEKVAESPKQSRPRLGAHASHLERVSTSETASRALRTPHCSEAVTRRAGCANRASPDPGEPRESDLPGPPDNAIPRCSQSRGNVRC
jgi:group II intron reverse transcriptase/maturase